MRRRVIIVFAKAPRMGSVKTRLARGIGQGPALAFYRASLDSTIRAARAVRSTETIIFTAPDDAVGGSYFPRGVPVLPQGRGGLGERMARALDNSADADRILVGGDIPGITSAILGDAFRSLAEKDAVFGPAEDGGFWLAGLRGGFRPRQLFRGVRWSAATTLHETVGTLPPHAEFAFCKTLNDIDDLGDYLRLT